VNSIIDWKLLQAGLTVCCDDGKNIRRKTKGFQEKKVFDKLSVLK
jgi:hypothetical protein